MTSDRKKVTNVAITLTRADILRFERRKRNIMIADNTSRNGVIIVRISISSYYASL